MKMEIPMQLPHIATLKIGHSKTGSQLTKYLRRIFDIDVSVFGFFFDSIAEFKKSIINK
ncbi:MAG: hypothetical protein QGG87_05935 [Nitrospinota bacterium]|nr:hypothetical protein [Nitrospinota bacterium]